MEVKVKNGTLPQLIGEFSQMLNEKLSLGTKHRIQKILKKLHAEYEQYNPALIDLLKKYGAIEKKTENGVNYSLTPEQITEEFLSEQKELSEVECILHVDPVDFNFIVNLETQVNYTFDLLQPFFENFA
jgi:regulator of sigma D